MDRCAIVYKGKVENLVVLDPISTWAPEEGRTLVIIPDDSPVGLGWKAAKVRNKWKFTDPNPPAPVEPEPKPETPEDPK